ATTTTTTITTVGDITLAQALEEIKSAKPKEKGIDIQELDKSTTTKSLQQSQDKGKRILIEPVIELVIEPVIEPVKPMKRKDQIRFDEEASLKLQAVFDEEERLAREKAKKVEEANIALIETWDDIQAKIDADHQLAERMQAQKQEELAFKRVNTFKDFKTELVNGKEKRAGTELIQEITKKQKVEDNKETAELKQFMEIIIDEEEVAIDAIHLSVKEDLEDLYKLVKAKYESTRPVEDLDLLLCGQMSEIKELQAIDRRRQTVISKLLRIDHRRSIEISELRTSLQGQVTALQGQVTALQAQ
nr:hypothetical protein [Tanacetum cinerariifolium]